MGLGLQTIEQRVAAGNDFDGTTPVGTPVRDQHVIAYPEGTAGGLFLIEVPQPVTVRTVELILGGQADWTLYKRDISGTDIIVFTGDTEVSFVSTERDAFTVTTGQSLLLISTGATAPLVARITYQATV